MSEEDFLSFVENMNFKGKYFCVFNQDDIYDDGSETLALEQEILAEYLYFFEVDDDSQKVMYTSARLHVLLGHTPEEIFG